MFEYRWVYIWIYVDESDCYDGYHQIKVNNCGEFYFYHLTPTPGPVCMRYCGYYNASLPGSASPSTSPLQPTPHIPIKVIINLK